MQCRHIAVHVARERAHSMIVAPGPAVRGGVDSKSKLHAEHHHEVGGEHKVKLLRDDSKHVDETSQSSRET